MFTFAGRQFRTVDAARLFLTAAALGLHPDGPHACQWVVQTNDYDEDGDRIQFDCGAEVIAHDNGWECTAGHEHTTTEARQAQGWEYAEDAYDAAVIARGGRRYRPMAPGTYLDPAEVARVYASI